MRSTNNRRELAGACRRLGFARYESTRNPLIYEKKEGVLGLDVQLWLGGTHRVSFSVDGHHDTPPTEFREAAELEAAVEVQRGLGVARMQDPAYARYRAMLATSHFYGDFLGTPAWGAAMRKIGIGHMARHGSSVRNTWQHCVECLEGLERGDEVFAAALKELTERPDQRWLTAGERLKSSFDRR